MDFETGRVPERKARVLLVTHESAAISSARSASPLDGQRREAALSSPPMPALSPDDLARAAAGCRALAVTYRIDAAKQTNPETRAGFEREAIALNQLAERFDKARAAKGSPHSR